MAVKKAFKDLSPDQKARVKAIMEEQEEEDIDLEDPEETVVETKKEKGKRILVIEGPEVDLILKQLGIDEDEVEETDDEREDEDIEEEEVEETPPPKKRASKKEIVEEEKEEPKPAPRSRYFGGSK
jgi:hypothetical protein